MLKLKLIKMDLNLYYWMIFLIYMDISRQVMCDVNIEPPVLDEIESNTARVICYSNSTNGRIRWVQNGSNICHFDLDSCNIIALPTNSKFNCSCNKTLNDTIISLEISNISRNDHNTSFRCVILSLNGTEKKDVNMSVKVPVKRLDISPNKTKIETSEHTNYQFNCTSSKSRPIPKITWIIADENNNRLKLIGKQTNSTDSDGFTSSFNSLNYYLNKSMNTWTIYCEVEETEVQLKTIKSNSISLNVTYPPESNLNINGYTTNGRYAVIANNTGKLICKIVGGNPKPLLTWNKCFDGEVYTTTPYDSTSTIVNKTLTWHAKPEPDRNCTCQSLQKERNDTVSIFVEVLYPPTIPKITFNGSFNVSESLDVLLGEKIVLYCDCNSKPLATYRWTAQNALILENKTLHIQEINKTHKGQYTCNATNIMTSTDKVQIGFSKKTIEINVLYPPSVMDLENLVFVEGAQVHLSCPISHGNPRETTFHWTSEREYSWPSQYLSISNVSRDNDMNYTCTVYNIMTQTGKSPVNGTDSAMFHLSVQYFATVKDFFVNEYKDQRNVTVNEFDNVTFICNIDSKPISNTSLRFTADKTYSLYYTKTNSLNYTLVSAKCTNAGTYFCYGNNKHNLEVASKKQLDLFVRCSPRSNQKFPYNVNLTSALNVSVVLKFPAIAYPKPATVLWQKFAISNWTNLTSNNASTDSGIEHNITLTIYNMSEKDFGQYRVIITNDAGSCEQNFNIIAEDIPKPPTGFSVIMNLTTATTATVKWFPSFDGGQPQQFVLNYSESHRDNWLNENINDTGYPIMNYTINRLSSGSVYYIVLYSVNKIGQSMVSEPIKFQTKVIPAQTGRNIIGIVIGSVCGVVGALLIVMLMIWFFRKRQNEKAPEKMIYQNVPNIGRHKESKQNKRNSLIRETQFFVADLQEVDDVPHITFERTEYNNSPDKIKEIDTIRISELFQYVLGQTEDDFAVEYQQIPTELQSSIAFARKPENIALNRYNGIFPYDHSRVKISTIPDFFMNACYIDGYKRRNAYIASLGPTEKTTNNFITFWQMVWYEKSELIVMLTNLREPSGMKCEQYWPESGMTMTYGEMCVSNVKTAIFSEFTIKRFLLSKGKDQRSITHLHFTAWPDKTVPEDTTTLIEFRHQMKTTATSTSGPIIVHCSAGIGRTGTLIAFDRLIEEGQDKHDVNIFECVKSMRKQRVKMVQTLEQYIYIYRALVGALCFESSYMTVKDLRSLVETPKHMYSKEYQQLKQTVDTVKKDEKDAFKRNENQTSKNRPGADVPGNRFRVFLSLNREHEDPDYINAVYINSFVKKEFFILAQTPLPGATEDFICLIYQEDCTCVVSMMDQKDSYQKIGKYLPDGDKILRIGNFKVSCSVLETKHHYTLKKMKICYEGRYERGVKIVYHFQYTQWLAEMEIPDNNVDFVQFVKDVHQYACELGDERSHVLAHCLKANERSGLFCAVLIILEKLDKENQVNISNTIRHLRTRRQSAITSMEQLQFCYQAASVYAKQLKNSESRKGFEEKQ